MQRVYRIGVKHNPPACNLPAASLSLERDVYAMRPGYYAEILGFLLRKAKLNYTIVNVNNLDWGIVGVVNT